MRLPYASLALARAPVARGGRESTDRSEQEDLRWLLPFHPPQPDRADSCYHTASTHQLARASSLLDTHQFLTRYCILRRASSVNVSDGAGLGRWMLAAQY